VEKPSELVARAYDEVAERYVRLEEETDWPRGRGPRELLAVLPDGADVLDLGCGAGQGTAAIAERHRAIGVDVSAVQLERARELVPGARFVHADMAELELTPESFDAVVSFYALGHVPRDDHVELLRRVHRWLRPGGYLLLSEEDSDVPDTFGTWLGQSMFFSHFDAATTTSLVEAAGFQVLSSEVETQLEDGTPIPYLWLLARRRAD
jgi:ubiquinone/menaquinone biosynthesis C-methylase UbiE